MPGCAACLADFCVCQPHTVRTDVWGSHCNLCVCVLCRMNNGPVIGYEEDVGRRTTFRLSYPESIFSDPIHYDPNTTVVIIVFKPRDLKWLWEILGGQKIVSLNIYALLHSACHTSLLWELSVLLLTLAFLAGKNAGSPILSVQFPFPLYASILSHSYIQFGCSPQSSCPLRNIFILF